MVEARGHDHFIPVAPLLARGKPSYASEPLTADYAWFRLQHVSEIPSNGLALFEGTRAERSRKYESFRAFVRQARVYWEAAQVTRGSAAALPLYYSMLNLAKASLVRTHPERVAEGRPIHHGLRRRSGRSLSIRGDSLSTSNGVFKLLMEARTGSVPPSQYQVRALNLLSLLPEIRMELESIGFARPQPVRIFQTLVESKGQWWPLVATFSDLTADGREPHTRRFGAGFGLVESTSVGDWRKVFGIAARAFASHIYVYESVSTFPDINSAGHALADAMDVQLAPAYGRGSDAYLVPVPKKSESQGIPLDLVRYACTFYMSELVRYKPAALDPSLQPAQAFVADSFVREVALPMLAGAVDNALQTQGFYGLADVQH